MRLGYARSQPDIVSIGPRTLRSRSRTTINRSLIIASPSTGLIPCSIQLPKSAHSDMRAKTPIALITVFGSPSISIATFTPLSPASLSTAESDEGIAVVTMSARQFLCKCKELIGRVCVGGDILDLRQTFSGAIESRV